MTAGQKRKWAETVDGHQSSQSDSDEEYDFENIDLEKIASLNNHVDTTESSAAKNSKQQITINLDANKTDHAKRYLSTAIARKIRYEVHKVNLLCLLSHAARRNRRIIQQDIKDALRPIREKFKGNIHTKVSSAQIQRTRVLLEGLETISDLWAKSFRVVAGGLTKPKWYVADDLAKATLLEPNSQPHVDEVDMLIAARTLQGDRDIGAQLLVALLRSLGLKSRLICSLQVLSLAAGKQNLTTMLEEAPSPARQEPPQLLASDTLSNSNTPQVRKLTRPRLGLTQKKPIVARPKPKMKIATSVPQSAYPVYWAEVFDPAAQKWYPLDPLVTGSVNKPNTFEPPQSEPDNTLSYAVAFADDGSAKDVTMRYTKQFNAKVRKNRVESVSNTGATWWLNLMKLWQPRCLSDQDSIENAEFAQKLLSEGIPANVSDLKQHPLFVIERHLSKHEIISPMRECGTITVGKSRPPIIEKVFPRKFVQRLRSALSWYLRGRQIKAGEQPLKRIQKRLRHIDEAPDGLEGPEAEKEGLYSEGQTDIFTPSPVINGVIPKNAFGNVDLFMPSMLPAGSKHFPRKDAEKAAQILGIDYGIAVTGFDHANRQTVPIKQGVVVATEYVDAMDIVQKAILEEAGEAADRQKTLTALTRWSHYLRSLRIRQHVQTNYGLEERASHANDVEEIEESQHIDRQGGFM